jgi:hypothetical protein
MAFASEIKGYLKNFLSNIIFQNIFSNQDGWSKETKRKDKLSVHPKEIILQKTNSK